VGLVVSTNDMQYRWHHDPRWRLAIAMVAGVLASIPVGLFWYPYFIPLFGWSVTAIVYAALTWASIWPMNAAQTAAYATRETPGAKTVHVLLMIAALASLGGIALLLFQSEGLRLSAFALSLLTVIVSWVIIHTIYTLRYARRYYNEGGGIRFNDEDPPQYSDFAYVSATVGMTYEVSDTALTNKDFRKMFLGHTLLSYLFGIVLLSALVSILAGLALA